VPVKGFEYHSGRNVLLSDEDCDSVKVESSAVMAVEKFIALNIVSFRNN
jgi:non-homologous end joining protein Ku